MYASSLLCVLNCAGFADNIHLNGARVLHSALDLGGDVTRQLNRTEVVNALGLNHHPYFAASTDGIDFFDALEPKRDVFKLTHTFHKVFGRYVAGARTGGA